MAKKAYYIYNPETDNYERVYPSYKDMIFKGLRYLLVGGIIGVAIFLIAFYGLASSTEKSLRKENAELRSQYNLINQRINTALDVMADLQERDDNMYRVLLHMEPVSSAQRIAGINNDSRYKSLQELTDSKLLIEVNRNMDILERQLYVQSQSYDRLQQEVVNNSEKIAHVPSMLPININDFILAAGYGNRRDQTGGRLVFHEGWDLTAKEGTNVLATADGIVKSVTHSDTEGYLIEIDHGYNYTTVYSYLSSPYVTEGTSIKKGQKIGEIGDLGNSTPTHLHYEVWFKDKPQDPVDYCFDNVTPQQYQKLKEQAQNASFLMD